MALCCSMLLGPGPINHQGSRHAKLQQVVVLLTAVTILLLFRFRFPDLVTSESTLAQRIASDSTRVFRHCTTAACFAEQAAGRTTIATFIYLIAMAIVTAYWPRFHFGYLLQKLFVWAGLLIVSFLIPVPVSDYLLSWAGIVIVALDLVAAVELISFACNIFSDRRRSPLDSALGAVVTSTTVAAAVYGCYLLSTGSCSVLYPIMIAVQIAIVVGVVLATRLIGSHSSLLTASIVTMYSMFTLYRAVTYRTRACSNEVARSDLIDGIGIAFNVVIVLYRAVSTRPISIFGSTAAHDLHDAVDLTLPTMIDANAKPLEAPVMVPARWSSSLFYLLLAMTLLYISVATGPNRSSSGTASFMCSVGTSVLISTLYVWTLIAPRLLPHRDFGVRAV